MTVHKIAVSTIFCIVKNVVPNPTDLAVLAIVSEIMSPFKKMIDHQMPLGIMR